MPLRIASLGSSFAAGPGIPPPDGPKAVKRSARNYPHLLAERLDAELTDLTISGATLLTIGSEPQTVQGTTFPPQVEDLSDDIDVVTITAGGNDLGYIGNLFLDSVKAYTLGAIVIWLYNWVYPASAATSPSHQEIVDRYVSVLDKIHGLAPKARIFIVEYLTLLGPETKPEVDVPLNAEQIEGGKRVADNLQRATAAAAEARTDFCIRIPVAELSLDHGIGSARPWVEGFGLSLLARGVAPYHPNADGMQAVTDMIYERLAD